MRPLLYSQLPEYVPLDVEEERALVIAAQAGDEAAMTKLLTTLHCLIVSMAQQRAWNSRSSFEDAVQNGFVGAIEGIMRFDISKGHRLSTYVRAWIFKEQYRVMRKERVVILPYVPQARIDRYPPELAAQYRQISACVSRPVYGIVTHTDRYDEGGTEYGVVSDNTLELLNKDTHRAAIRQIDDHELLEYFLQFIHPTEADEIREAWFSDRDWHEIAREHGLAYKTYCMRMRITLIKLQLIGKAYNEGAHIPYFKPRRDIAPHVLQDSWCRGKLLRYAPKKHVVSQKSGLVECTKQKGKKKRKKKAYTLALDVPLASCDGSKPQRVRLRFV